LQQGHPIPERIANAPEIKEHMRFYIEAFFDLTSERQIGFAEGPIPFFAIVNYARLLDCDAEDFADLLYFIREMDSEYLSFRAKKNN